MDNEKQNTRYCYTKIRFKLLTNMKKEIAKLLKAYHKKWDCFGRLIKCKKKK
jgi:hypothetical protein